MRQAMMSRVSYRRFGDPGKTSVTSIYYIIIFGQRSLRLILLGFWKIWTIEHVVTGFKSFHFTHIRSWRFD